MLVYSRKEPSIRTSFPHRQSHHLSSFPFALCLRPQQTKEVPVEFLAKDHWRVVLGDRWLFEEIILYLEA